MSGNENRGFFRRSFDALIAAREKEADRFVSTLMLNLDDEQLAKRGLTRAALRRSARR